MSGVTSNIQDQLNGKANSVHAAHPDISCQYIEMGSEFHGGFIDFHYGHSSADYTSRIIENSNGYITIYSPKGFKIIGDAGDLMTANSLGSVWFTNLCVDNNFGDTLPEAKGWGQIYFLRA